jgi:hypothetical protein
MNQAQRNEAYGIFIKAWGNEAQLIMVIEETAELQKEVTKCLRGRDNIDSIIEEVVDVEIMLEQLKLMFKMDKNAINEMKEVKIKRAIQKINDYST